MNEISMPWFHSTNVNSNLSVVTTPVMDRPYMQSFPFMLEIGPLPVKLPSGCTAAIPDVFLFAPS